MTRVRDRRGAGVALEWNQSRRLLIPSTLSLSKGCPSLQSQGQPFDELRDAEMVVPHQINIIIRQTSRQIRPRLAVNFPQAHLVDLFSAKPRQCFRRKPDLQRHFIGGKLFG